MRIKTIKENIITTSIENEDIYLSGRKTTNVFDKNENVTEEDEKISRYEQIEKNSGDVILHDVAFQNNRMRMESDILFLFIFQQIVIENKKNDVPTTNVIALNRVRKSIKMICEINFVLNRFSDISNAVCGDRKCYSK